MAAAQYDSAVATRKMRESEVTAAKAVLIEPDGQDAPEVPPAPLLDRGQRDAPVVLPYACREDPDVVPGCQPALHT